MPSGRQRSASVARRAISGRDRPMSRQTIAAASRPARPQDPHATAPGWRRDRRDRVVGGKHGTRIWRSGDLVDLVTGVVIDEVSQAADRCSSPTRSRRSPDRQINRSPTSPDSLDAEMMTVFSNASPMLSDDTDGMSATARWTMRRSYGLSGPISWARPVSRAFSARNVAICLSSASLLLR